MRRKTIQLAYLCIVFLLASPAAYGAEFAGGAGTSADPYQIATAEQLISIGSDPNLLNKHFVMVNDIDLDPNLSPKYAFDDSIIGKGDSGLSGVFDGHGFRIRHLTIMGNAQQGEKLGFCSRIKSGGEVKRLILEDVYIASSPDLPWSSTGAICGSIEGVIFRCSVTGVISGGYRAGGLAGMSRDGVTEECASTCVISGANSGGLVGHCGGVVRNCYASGRVSGEIAGGLVSDISGLIIDCYAACRVDSRGPLAGGLVGYEYRPSDIVNSYFLAIGDGGGPDNGFGIPLTSSQMKQASSFVAWGFWETGKDGFRIPWYMPDHDYPELAWTGFESVPPVSGLSVEQAYDLMERSGVRIHETMYDYDHAVEYGRVASAYPSPALPPGSEMTLIVSLGPYNWSINAGDMNDPHLILSPGQFGCLAHDPGLWDQSFRLISDLDMACRVYSRPLIGWSESGGLAFSGVFNGDGHIIMNLTIEGGATDEGVPERLGLFGEIGTSGRVKDLGLTGISIQGREYRDEIGGMLCAVNDGSISRCYSQGTLGGYGQLGGLVGSNSGVIENCYAEGNVEDLSFRDRDGLYAGLVASNTTGTIHTCYATCRIHLRSGINKEG